MVVAKCCLLLLVFSVGHCREARERVSLSPSLWPADTIRRLETISQRKNTRPKPLVYSNVQGLVSGTTSYMAVHAGKEALRKGGNAMDACITTAMAEISLTAGAEVSFAGVTNILYYDHMTARVHNLDAGWKIPRLRDWEQRPTLETLGDSVLVPGIVAGLYEAAEFTEFPMSTLMEPALYFAEEGFKMPHRLSKLIHKYYENTLKKNKAGRNIFTNPKTRKPFSPSELFRQPQLAQFIRKLQQHGKNYMYQGNWTRAMVDVVTKHGGRITLRDMASYQAQWVEPASTTYNGYHVTTAGSDWGGVELVEMLKLLQLADFSKTNDTYLTNATKLLAVMSISRYSQFISEYLHRKPRGTETIREYLGVDATPKGRISNKSTQTIWSHLNNREGVDMINNHVKELLSDLPNFDFLSKRKRGSAGIVAIDNNGNVCAMSHTANSEPWGTGLFVEGVVLPHSGAVFQDLLFNHRPGSFIPSGLQPVLIFKNKPERRRESPIPVREKPTREPNELPPLSPRGDFTSPTESENEVDEIPVRVTPPWRTKIRTSRPRIVPKEQLSPPGLMIRGMRAVAHKSDSRQQRSHITKSYERARIRPKPATNFFAPKRALEPVAMAIGNARMTSGRAAWNNWIRRKRVKEETPSREWEEEENMVGKPFEREEEENLVGKHFEGEEEENLVGKPFEREEENHVEEEQEREREPLEGEEPQTIGGLFTENDINSIFGKFSSRGYPRRFKTSRKKWFQNIVRQIFQHQKKKDKNRNWKIRSKPNRNKRRQLHPVAALAVIGQSAPEAMLQYINNLLDNGMDAKQASDAPMFFSPIPGSSRQISRVERFVFSHDVISGVRSRGQEVDEIMHKFSSAIAGMGAVLTVHEGKQAYGCSHPECEGYAESQ